MAKKNNEDKDKNIRLKFTKLDRVKILDTLKEDVLLV